MNILLQRSWMPTIWTCSRLQSLWENKNTRKLLAGNIGTLALRRSDSVKVPILEEYHKVLRGYTDIFTKIVYQANDCTYHNLKNFTQ